MIPFGPTVHTLKVALRGVKPPVWRRVVVPSETTLPKLAHMLEAAMGWQGYHLHMFDAGGVLFGEPDEDADDMIDERRVTVKHVLPRVKSKLRWDYDFGDGWEHDVVAEAIDAPTPRVRYPVCVGGKRACPPEDSGGVPGYERLIAALKDPLDPEHDDFVTWAPDGFDPAAFDVAEANQRLRSR